MSRRTTAFGITGVASTTTQDASGIQSTAEEQKYLHGMFVSIGGRVGNKVVGHIGQTQHVEEYDYWLSTPEASGTNQYRTTNGRDYIAITRVLEVGEVFKAGVECGGTADDLYGAYDWELVSEMR